MRIIRSVLTLVMALVAFGGITAVSALPAQASTAAISCSGSVTDRFAHPSGLGELVIYYNSTNGGTNSACFYHRGAAAGVAAPTYVIIHRCAETSGEGGPCTIRATGGPDSGNFSSYAGPVGVTGTANYCVAAYGHIDWRGTRYALNSGRQGCPN
ncbi:hypothetical protein [Actinokineospora iranica]|uniref:Spore-associated protein A n=1 Tax=Actinokineospora iranica TaxID=1271860 RepID=A0A1G6RAX8_9PSEU|nr:hypothetical protein [Actinokineospora iranica]SDD01464.1 hypothetical protein SAMN05216174_106239 [Actinokineospora iranica]